MPAAALVLYAISMEPSVVGRDRDWSPVSSNKARGCCCRTSCRPLSPIAAEARSPAVFAHIAYVVHREPTPGLPEVRGWAGAGAAGASFLFLCQLPLWFWF
jgi:hypothetical protein